MPTFAQVMGIWADFKCLVDLGGMDYKDVKLLVELQSSNKAYRVIRLSFEESTTGAFESGMQTNSLFEFKYNDKFYKEKELIENEYNRQVAPNQVFPFLYPAVLGNNFINARSYGSRQPITNRGIQ